MFEHVARVEYYKIVCNRANSLVIQVTLLQNSSDNSVSRYAIRTSQVQHNHDSQRVLFVVV